MEGYSVLMPALFPPITDCPQNKDIKTLLSEEAISRQEDYQKGCCLVPQLIVPNPANDENARITLF